MEKATGYGGQSEMMSEQYRKRAGPSKENPSISKDWVDCDLSKSCIRFKSLSQGPAPSRGWVRQALAGGRPEALTLPFSRSTPSGPTH